MPRGIYKRRPRKSAGVDAVPKGRVQAGAAADIARPEFVGAMSVSAEASECANAAEPSKQQIGLLAIRGYILAIRMAGGEPDGRDILRISQIVDEALTEGGER